PANAVINVNGTGSQFNDILGQLQISNGAQLNVTSGGAVNSKFFDVGFNSTGSAVFDGVGTSLTVTNAADTIGWGGTGTLTLRNGATGGFSGLGGTLFVGAGGTGTLNVQSGASLN